MTVDGEDDGELLAMELAFGLLEGEEEAAARARVSGEPTLAAAHARWHNELTEILLSRAETPRPSLWQQITSRLPANDDQPGPPARGWKIATAAASLAAVGFALFSLRPQAERIVVRQVAVQQVSPRPVLAVLTSETEHAAVAISIDRLGGQLSLAPVKLELRRKVPELWVIPAGGKPHALGVVSTQFLGTFRPPRDAMALIRAGATLAISEEPVGGSPTGQPTGRVIVAGTVTDGA